MTLYKVIIKEEAQADLEKLLRHEPKIYAKALKFIGELFEHPKTGLGHPEPLKGKPENRWSREITKKHRLVIASLRQRSMSMFLLPTAITKTSRLALLTHRRPPYSMTL